VDLEAVQVADDQQRRVLQRLAVLQKLLVGRLQILAFALVLPGKVTALPDIREPAAAANLLDALLEGVVLPGRVGLVGRRNAQHAA
jgi:hypothetical protein